MTTQDTLTKYLVGRMVTAVAYGLGLIWRGPMVAIATGEQARAARQALEEK